MMRLIRRTVPGLFAMCALMVACKDPAGPERLPNVTGVDEYGAQIPDSSSQWHAPAVNPNSGAVWGVSKVPTVEGDTVIPVVKPTVRLEHLDGSVAVSLVADIGGNFVFAGQPDGFYRFRAIPAAGDPFKENGYVVEFKDGKQVTVTRIFIVLPAK